MLKNTDEEPEDSAHVPTFKGKQVCITGSLMNTNKGELAKQLFDAGLVEVKWNTSLGDEANIVIKGRRFSEKLIDKATFLKLKILSQAEVMKLLKNCDTDLSHTIKNDKTKIVMSLIRGMKVKDLLKPLAKVQKKQLPFCPIQGCVCFRGSNLTVGAGMCRAHRNECNGVVPESWAQEKL